MIALKRVGEFSSHCLGVSSMSDADPEPWLCVIFRWCSTRICDVPTLSDSVDDTAGC